MNQRLVNCVNFHKKFWGTNLQEPSLDLNDDFKEFRVELMKEEFEEMCEAIRSWDTVNLAKEFADVICSLCGTIVEFGYQNIMDKVVQEVLVSNMSKDIAPNGRKAIKWKWYNKANIAQFFTHL